MEVWKDIKDYEGFYQVSNKGRIRSLDRPVLQRNSSIQIKKGLVLKLAKNHKGYPMVSLSKNNKKDFKSVHRLVALTFIENPDKKEQVNHIDGNKENNCLSNLEWVTASENIRHAINNGLMTINKENLEKATKKANKINQKRVNQYNLKGELINTFNSMIEAEEKTSAKAKGISEVVRGKQVTAGGYIWRYA